MTRLGTAHVFVCLCVALAAATAAVAGTYDWNTGSGMTTLTPGAGAEPACGYVDFAGEETETPEPRGEAMK